MAFPFIALLFVFLSLILAFHKAFRTGNPEMDWIAFCVNISSFVFNLFVVLLWTYTRIVS